MQILTTSATASVLVGPILDSTGVEYTSGLVIGDLNITKNGTSSAMSDSGGAHSLTHSHNGHWVLGLLAGDTGIPGRLDVTCNKTGYIMPPLRFEVCSGGNVPSDIQTVLGETASIISTPPSTSQITTAILAATVPTSNTAHTVADALNAARAQGFGKWVLSGTTLTLYASDGTTSVRTFTLAPDGTAPTSRT